jgi:hypothetical protein
VEFEASEPLTLRLRLKPLDEVDSADIEPNDRPIGATRIERGDGSSAGTIHLGDTADWVEFPWKEDEEAVNLSLAPMPISGVRLRWKTLDGWYETSGNEEGEGLRSCGVQREPGASSFKVGVIASDVLEQPLDWSLAIESIETATFESEPNDERLLSMEVPRWDGGQVRGESAAVFAVPNRELRTTLRGYVGQRDDERDVYPFRVGRSSNGGEPVSVEVKVTPPSRADLKLSLIDSDGAAVARSLDGGMGAEESVRATLPPGLYHAVVELDDGEPCAGAYEILIHGEVSSDGRSSIGSDTPDGTSPEGPEAGSSEDEGENPVSNEEDIAPPPLERPGAD